MHLDKFPSHKFSIAKPTYNFTKTQINLIQGFTHPTMMSLEYEIDSPSQEQQYHRRSSSMKSIDSTSKRRRSENGPLHVSFNPQAELVFIETVQEYTPEEIVSAYYQNYEYKQIKAGNKILTKHLKTGQIATQPPFNNDGNENENEICYRGLEHKTDTETKRRRQTRFESSMAVYEEQIRQQADGVVDEELLRDVYRAEVYLDQEVAYEIGARDAIEADLCWRNDTVSSSLLFNRATATSLMIATKKKDQRPSTTTTSSTTPSHSKTLIERLIGSSRRPERTR